MKVYILWFLAAFVLIILEPLLPGLVIIWFGLGALFAGVFALLGASFYLQLVIFGIVSVLSLIFIRRMLEKEGEDQNGIGSLRLIGKEGKVIKSISAGDYGMVKVDGEEWRAFSHEECREGELVKVIKVDGTHLLVVKEKNKEVL